MRKLSFSLLRLLCGAGLLAAALPAPGVTLCVSDRPAAPLTFPDHEGQAQYLVRNAVGAAGAQANFVVQPWRRCIASLQAGTVDGVLGVQAFQAYKDFARFPLKNGVPDPAYALGIDTWVVVSYPGSGVSWDGLALHGLSAPVSYPAGVNVVKLKLEALQIRHADNAKTALQLMQMLNLKRYQAVVIREADARGFLALPPYQSMQVLAPVFLLSEAYLVFSLQFATANPRQAEQIWEGIRRLRTSASWPQLAPALAK